MIQIGMDVVIVLFGIAFLVLVMVVFATNGRQGDKKLFVSPPVIDWKAINDAEVQEYVANRRKIEAIKRYRELTDVGLKEAKDAIEYAIDYPEAARRANRWGFTDDDADDRKGAMPPDAGVRHLVRQGKLTEAVNLYRDFTGVSLVDAEDAIQQIEQEIGLETTDEGDRADRAGLS